MSSQLISMLRIYKTKARLCHPSLTSFLEVGLAIYMHRSLLTVERDFQRMGTTAMTKMKSLWADRPRTTSVHLLLLHWWIHSPRPFPGLALVYSIHSLIAIHIGNCAVIHFLERRSKTTFVTDESNVRRPAATSYSRMEICRRTQICRNACAKLRAVNVEGQRMMMMMMMTRSSSNGCVSQT
jgi:hypothetical protein